MSKDGRNNASYLGLDVSVSATEHLGRALNVIVTSLYMLDPDMFHLVLRRLSAAAPPELDGALKEPWHRFGEFIRRGVDSTEAAVREQSGIKMSTDAVFMLQGDFRQMAIAILAYSLSEKESGLEPVNGDEVYAMFHDGNRAQTLMEWLDTWSSEKAHEAVLGQLLQQAARLKVAFPLQWDETLEAQLAEPGQDLIECVHAGLCKVCDVIFNHTVPWPQLRNSWVKPGRTLQDEASLLTVALVVLYHLYPEQSVRQAIVDASRLVTNEEALHGVSHRSLDPEDDPPPRTPPRGREKLRVVK